MGGIFTQEVTPGKYDSAEWIQALATNYDVRGQALFVNCGQPTKVIIRTDTTLTVKFNSTANAAITVSPSTAFEFNLTFNQMYITTTGSTAVKVIFTQV